MNLFLTKMNMVKMTTMVGNGFTITYEMLDNLSKKPTKNQNTDWTLNLDF